MRILHLYRPRLPGLRAQAIQVVHACEALAARGHEVTLLADRSRDGDLAPDEVLRGFGLDRPAGLDLRLAPSRHKGLAGAWFRWELRRWWRQGPAGLVLARDKRRLLEALGRHGRGPGPAPGHAILLEAHELDSAQAAEAGRDPGPERALEEALLPHLDALVANCGGTLRAWEAAYGDRLPRLRRAVHNGTAPSRAVAPVALAAGEEPVVRVLGSPKAYKDAALLHELAARLPLPLELVGGSDEDRAALARADSPLRLRPPVPYAEVPGLLARSAVLLLPLRDNLFGRQLTSPLKLWDYLATRAPVVAPRLPSVEEIATLTGAPVHWARAGDVESHVAAVARALAAPPREPVVRTWADRAAELEELLAELGSSGVSAP